MNYRRLRRAFTSGELSPLIKARVDLDRYKNGCLSLLNMYILPQGPAVRRPGTIFKGDLQTYATGDGFATITKCREVPFIFSAEQAYALLFLHDGTNDWIYFVYGDGLLEDPSVPGTPYCVTISSSYNFDIENFDYAQSKDYLYLAYSANKTLQLTRSGHTTWAVSVSAYTVPQSDGATDDWSNTIGWPEKVSFFEQRLVFGGSAAHPQRIWFSEAGDYDNFTLPATYLPESPMSLQIASGQHNDIVWLKSSRQLFVGTLGDEWIVSGGGSPIAYNTIQIARHTNQGSEAIIPIVIGSATLFIERLGRVINQMTYEYSIDSYETNDLSVLAPHLTADYSIESWAYQQTPNDIIWCVMGDGNLNGMTYQREHKIVGWHRHETDGTFKDVCCIPSSTDRETATWFLVEREVVVGGTPETHLYLEKLSKEFIYQTDSSDFNYLDSSIEFDNTGSPTDNITGLDHLEGQTVDIVADGGYHPAREVNSGEITLDAEYEVVSVGLGFTSELIPTEPELALRDGTVLGRMRRIVETSVMLYRSVGFSIGREGSNLEEIPFRTPEDPTGIGVPLFTGTKTVDFPEGHDRDPVIYLRQTKPLPLNVVGIVDLIEITESELEDED